MAVPIERKTWDVVVNENHNNVKLGFYVSPSGKKVSIASQLKKSLALTCCYPADYIFTIPEISPETKPNLEITQESTIAALKRIVVDLKEGKAVGLNFANAIEKGGGYRRGAMAQEEMICHASALFASIDSKHVKLFYEDNYKSMNTNGNNYTDDLIYSPQVPVWRDDNEVYLEEPFVASFITSPAPCNIRNTKADEAPAAIRQRIRKIIQCAIQNGYKNIVLGAFGCGAFRNNPNSTAESFRVILMDEGYGHFFKHIVFAIWSRPGRPTENYNAFKEVLLASPNK